MGRIGFYIYVLVVIAVSLVPCAGLETPGVLDKIGHFAAYAIMSFWGLVLFRSQGSPLLVLLFCLLLGVSLEYMQLLVSGREASIADGLANFIGVTTGALACYIAKSTTIGKE